MCGPSISSFRTIKPKKSPVQVSLTCHTSPRQSRVHKRRRGLRRWQPGCSYRGRCMTGTQDKCTRSSWLPSLQGCRRRATVRPDGHTYPARSSLARQGSPAPRTARPVPTRAACKRVRSTSQKGTSHVALCNDVISLAVSQ